MSGKTLVSCETTGAAAVAVAKSRVPRRLSRFLAVVLCAAVMSVPRAVAAAAITVNFPGSYFPTGGDSGVQGYDNSSISTIRGSVLTGGDQLVPTGGGASFQAFCVDLSHSISIGSTNLSYTTFADTDSATTAYFSSLYSGANGANVVNQLEQLASHALPLVTDANSSAAFQIAVWDIAFGGTVSTTANGANASTVSSDVTQFLGLASQGGPITERMTYLMSNGHNGGAVQNLVTFAAPPAPVPVPQTLPLLLSGLVTLGAIAWRRTMAPAADTRGGLSLMLRQSVTER